MQKWLSHIHRHARDTCELDMKQHTLPLSLKKGGKGGGDAKRVGLNLLLWEKKNYLDCGPPPKKKG